MKNKTFFLLLALIIFCYFYYTLQFFLFLISFACLYKIQLDDILTIIFLSLKDNNNYLSKILE